MIARKIARLSFSFDLAHFGEPWSNGFPAIRRGTAQDNKAHSEPPIIIELRDLGSAKNKRRLIMRVKPGIWNKRLKRGVIAAHQKEAVDHLEDDWNAALRIAYASAGSGLGAAPHASGPQLSKLEADERIKRAREAVVADAGAISWKVVDYAVMFDYTFELIAKKLKCQRQNVVLHLRRGLDALARHYGMMV